MIVSMPDGAQVSFPDDMPPEEIKGLISSKYPDDVKSLTGGEWVVRPLVRAARSGLVGLASIADIGGAAVPIIKQGMRAGLEKAGVDFMGANTPYIPPSEGVKNIFDSLTNNIGKPQTDSEKIVDVAGEALANGGGMKALQRGSQALIKGGSQLLERLAPQTGTELAATAGAGAGAEVANQIDPGDPVSVIIGALVGGVATTKGINAIRNSGDIKLLDNAYFNRNAQRNPDTNQGYFNKQAGKILEKNLSPDKAVALRQELIDDKNLVLPDIGGDEVRALTRQIGKVKGGPRSDIDKFLTDRDNAAAQRISNVINSKVSGVDKYYGSLDELAAVRGELAKEQWTDAYKKHENMKLTPSLDKFIQDGRFQSALADARKEGLINIEDRVNSLRTLDNVYRRLRDKAGDFAAKNQNEAAKVYGDFARDFVRRLDVEAPEFKSARNNFSGFSSLMDAQEAGRNYIKLTPEQINKQLNSFTPGEKDAYKIGVRESLQNEVMKTANSASEANRIFGKAMQRQQLRQILGSEFPEFSRKLRKEIRMADTKFRVLGGSRTDYNTIEDGQFIESAARAVRGGKVAITNEIINTVSDALKNKYMGINPNNARILSKALTTNKGGIKALDDMIAKQTSSTQKKLLQSIKADYGHLLIPTLGVGNEEM